MTLKLPCQVDAREIGIEDERGIWDTGKFFDHIIECDQCFAKIKHLLELLDDAIKERPRTCQA